MYCRHCGELLREDSKFCSKCGKPVDDDLASDDSAGDNGNTSIVVNVPTPDLSKMKERAEKTRDDLSKSIQSIDSSKAKVGDSLLLRGLADIALIVGMLLPWVNINVVLWQGSYGVFDLATIGSELGRQLAYYGGVDETVAVAFVCLVGFWVAALAVLVHDAYSCFIAKKNKGIMAFCLCCGCAVVFIAILYFIDSSITQELGSYAPPVSIISATIWTWACAIGSAILAYVTRKKPKQS